MSKTSKEFNEIRSAIQREQILEGLDAAQQGQLAELIRLLVAGQDRMNLTAIRNPLAMVRYHLADSMALLHAMRRVVAAREVKQAMDIGTGGGFPLLPMAVALPGIHWTGIESVQKKAAFVKATAAELGLENVSLLPERAEDIGRGELRGMADLVTARAVGPVAALLEVGVPLLAMGGRIYLFKTEIARAEWDACQSVLANLGAKAAGEWSYQLEGDAQQRVILIAQKIADTPEIFPRRAGVPFKKPLSR